jgi:Tfp pilus assembly protein PilZ
VTLLTSQDKTEGETKNVSPTGAFISCTVVPLSEGSLRLVIKVPGHQPINVAGKVVWSKVLNPNKGAPSFGMGVQFTKISENDSHFLREVILKRYGTMINRLIAKTEQPPPNQEDKSIP